MACTLANAAHCLDLLKPFQAEQMTAYEVFPLVNKGLARMRESDIS